MTLSPRESGKFIAEHSSSVKINKKEIEKLGDLIVKEVESGRLSVKNFSQTEVHPKSDDEGAIDWLFFVDTLNFCFWHHENEPGWTVEGYTGYFALCAAVNRARKEGLGHLLNPLNYAKITEKELSNLLRSDNGVSVPLLQERMECLHEVGGVLNSHFQGSFVPFVEKADHSAVKLLDLIITNFKCFKDEAVYKGTKVAFYKRAQILIGDIWACFKNEGLGFFKDIDQITMFADYRVPQSLLFYGIFEYDENLLKKLENNTILKNGEEDEIEIRGCSIHAVELLNEYAKSKVKEANFNSVLIDHFLWDFRRKHAKEIEELKLPFHKTFSIYY